MPGRIGRDLERRSVAACLGKGRLPGLVVGLGGSELKVCLGGNSVTSQKSQDRSRHGHGFAGPTDPL